MFERVLTRNFGLPRSETIDTYMANGGYQALPKALQELTPGQLIDIVTASGLRGQSIRAGIGPENHQELCRGHKTVLRFPAGRKVYRGGPLAAHTYS